MKKLLLIPALLFAACADVQTDDGQVDVATQDNGAGNNETFDTPTLLAGFIFEPGSCDDNSALIEGHVGYSDGSSADNVTCQLQFEDGSTVDSCFAVRSFPQAETVVLVATDSVTGATARYSETVAGPLSFDASLDVSSSGTSISWNADAFYGGFAGAGNTRISIEPAANVVAADPSIFQQRAGTVTVTAPGTYTITVVASLQFGEVGGCADSVTKTIDITVDEPPPPCPTNHAE